MVITNTYAKSSTLALKEIPRVQGISKEEFVRLYVKPQKPVIFERLTKEWPAYHKWDLDHISTIAGDNEVPLFDNRPISSKYKFNEPHAKMKMRDYIALLQSKPTSLRIFLYNLLKEVPKLQNDFKFPDIGLRFVKHVPMLFFGGSGAEVFMHYDIDYPNLLHVQFHGEKQCILFPPSESKYLYKVPNAVIAHQDIDFNNPDFNKWPALKLAKGYRTTLKHGDALYLPEGYWHHMTYLNAGFGMSLRALSNSPRNFSKAVYNVAFMRYFDNFMRKIVGQRWIDFKNRNAITRTNQKNKITT